MKERLASVPKVGFDSHRPGAQIFSNFFVVSKVRYKSSTTLLALLLTFHSPSGKLIPSLTNAQQDGHQSSEDYREKGR